MRHLSKFAVQSVFSFNFLQGSREIEAVLRHSPQRCIGGSSPQHCNALQYIALYYNVAQAVIHAVKRRPAGLRGVSVATLKDVPRD